MNELLSLLPEMYTNDILENKLTVLPFYDEKIREKSPAERLMALSEIYEIYIPSQMSIEIYSKMYLGMFRSMQKKYTRASTLQAYENRKMMKRQEYNSVIGGSDSFTIIGNSGIGKSSAIDRAVSLISEERVVEIKKPYSQIIPSIVVQCPFDCSVKGMLLEILRKVDETLETDFCGYGLKSKATTDMLIGSVSQVCMNHVGLLVIDEIQNVVNSKNGRILISSLTQLINNSGVSICMVGTPECNTFFDQTSYLARRAVGLQYTTIKYNAYFKDFCRTVFDYQYTAQTSEISDVIIEWLYQHSAGVVSNVVALIHDAQEIAIVNGIELLDLDTLNAAYNQRLGMLHSYIRPSIVHNSQTSKTNTVRKTLPDKTV